GRANNRRYSAGCGRARNRPTDPGEWRHGRAHATKTPTRTRRQPIKHKFMKTIQTFILSTALFAGTLARGAEEAVPAPAKPDTTAGGTNMMAQPANGAQPAAQAIPGQVAPATTEPAKQPAVPASEAPAQEPANGAATAASASNDTNLVY